MIEHNTTNYYILILILLKLIKIIQCYIYCMAISARFYFLFNYNLNKAISSNVNDYFSANSFLMYIKNVDLCRSVYFGINFKYVGSSSSTYSLVPPFYLNKSFLSSLFSESIFFSTPSIIILITVWDFFYYFSIISALFF